MFADRRHGKRVIEKMEEADGILLGSPTYVADISPEIKALMDRAVPGLEGERRDVPAQGRRRPSLRCAGRERCTPSTP